MKFILAALVLVSSTGFASTRKPASAPHSTKSSKTDCGAFALDAAEEEYGNEPDGTHVTRKPNNMFVVTVGIGNPEDGAHSYLVNCPKKSPICDCSVVKEIDRK